ncbi:hypothetical protein HDU92_007315 [Lobulomyces angularis]|nr:hypothetical protein HDU92_007315 [Lobulomyces angularis]
MIKSLNNQQSFSLHFNNISQKQKPSNLKALNITIPTYYPSPSNSDNQNDLPESPIVPSQPRADRLDSAFEFDFNNDKYYLELTDDHTEGMERYARESVRLAVESTKKLTLDYKLTSFLGWGEHGVVLGATRIVDHKPCVIKFIYKKNDQEKSKNTIPDEILLFQNFNHPNILQFVEYFEDDDNFFLVTSRILNYKYDFEIIDEDEIQPWDECISIETISGTESIIRVPLRNGQCDLFSYLEKFQTLSIDQIRKVVFGLVKSIHYLHTELNITHGDIKEENVLINQNTFQSFLTDFGHSKVRVKDKDSNKFLKCESLYGTFEYVPPEFIPNFKKTKKNDNNTNENEVKKNNNTQDCQQNNLIRYESGFEADIWALGILLYSCSTGLLSAKEHSNFFQLCCLNKFDKKCYPIENNYNFAKIKSEEELVDLIKGMLMIDPKERFTINDCLKHKFFENCC